MNQLANKQQTNLQTLEQVLIDGNLKALTPEQRLQYVNRLCDTLGLNPLTKPFEYREFQQGKLILYANKGCAEQLRMVHKVSIEITDRRIDGDLYVVTARAKTPDGRCDEDSGAVVIGHLKGDARANAMMKATTKAKRRVTLSLLGLNMLDETEVETIPGAVPTSVTPEQQPQVESQATRLVTEAQIKRLYAITKSSNWTNEDAKSYLEKTFNLTSSRDLNRTQYDQMCAYIEANPLTTGEPESAQWAPTDDTADWPPGK